MTPVYPRAGGTYSRLQDLPWGARTAELAKKRSDSPRRHSRPKASLKRNLIGHRHHPPLGKPTSYKIKKVQ
ncbi:hypothetical protein R50073_37170 [Maricurvus nonylphenolicus]